MLFRLLLIFTVLLNYSTVFSQNETAMVKDSLLADSSLLRIQEFDTFYLPKNYHSQYQIALRRIRRVYPLALHAAIVIDSLERELEASDKKRKKKKIARETHKELREDFKYLLKELYVSEGIVLSKLVYRETGMTVEEIIEKYKGSAQASLYKGLASFFDQELDATYDPDYTDFVLECVIRDIESGKVDFDPSFQIVDKAHYKLDRKKYKQRVKENKKKLKEHRKKIKQHEKEKKKEVKKQKRSEG